MVYCDSLYEITKDMPLQVALTNNTLNSQIIAECYIKQKGLVDAVRTRVKIGF